MDLNTKAEVLTDAWIMTENVDLWQDYRGWANLGLPFAWGFVNGYIKLTKSGEEAVFEAYDMLCKVLSLDNSVEYESFEAMLADNKKVNA